MNKTITRSLLLLLAISFFWGAAPAWQVTQSQVDAELKGMSPQEIDSKLKELGISREEAETRAKSMGLDVSGYLRGLGGTGTEPKDAPVKLATPPAAPLPEDADVGVERKEPPAPGKKWYETDDGLIYFGYNIFDGVPSAFEPTATGPADPEYLIGPEDGLRLVVWGQAEFQYDLTVDKEGRIFIPTVGQILLTGLTLEKAYDKLLKVLSRSYSGLVGQNPTVWMDLSISRLRPKRIFILGEIRKPGGYTVHSYATVFNSLYSIGGPTLRGSLRDVRVLRNNKVITHIDLYDYLTGAEETNDIRVQTNDQIFIPVRGKTVTLRGFVMKPGIYELKDGETFTDLLRFAGGFESEAYVERIKIQRIIPFNERQFAGDERQELDIDYMTRKKMKQDIQLEDRDEVIIRSILDVKRNYVSIRGAIQRPGTYQLDRFPTLRSVIMAADSLRPDAYPERIDVMRLRQDSTLVSYQLDLQKVLTGDESEDFTLEPWDAIKVWSRGELIDRRSVSISGHVKNPGSFPYADSMTVYDLLYRAGGLQDSLFRARTYMDRADLTRLNPDGYTRRTISLNLDSVLAMSRAHNLTLLPLDHIFVHEINVDVLTDLYVTVQGSVHNPGQFNLTTNMTVVDAVLLAGGFTEEALRTSVYVSRKRSPESPEETLSVTFQAPLSDFGTGNPSYGAQNGVNNKGSLLLQHRDIVIVRKDPTFEPQRLVVVSGEVEYPGTYSLERHNESLTTLISRAGGITPSGYPAAAKIRRGEKIVKLRLGEALRNPGGPEDVILTEGDDIRIPRKPNVVDVRGEVNNEGLFSYVPGQSMWDYIERAGSVTDSAEHVFLYMPNGESQKYDAGGLGKLFEGDPRIQDGSTIVVSKRPPDMEQTTFDLGKTITDVMAVVASTLTILVLANRL